MHLNVCICDWILRGAAAAVLNAQQGRTVGNTAQSCRSGWFGFGIIWFCRAIYRPVAYYESNFFGNGRGGRRACNVLFV